jgi:hypothetical protein
MGPPSSNLALAKDGRFVSRPWATRVAQFTACRTTVAGSRAMWATPALPNRPPEAAPGRRQDLTRFEDRAGNASFDAGANGDGIFKTRPGNAGRWQVQPNVSAKRLLAQRNMSM